MRRPDLISHDTAWGWVLFLATLPGILVLRAGLENPWRALAVAYGLVLVGAGLHGWVRILWRYHRDRS